MGLDGVPRANVSCGWTGAGRRGDQHARQDVKRHGQVAKRRPWNGLNNRRGARGQLEKVLGAGESPLLC